MHNFNLTPRDSGAGLKLALVSCANGFGHLKRLIRILNHLIDHVPLKRVTLFCDARTLRDIIEWREYRQVQKRFPVEIVDAHLPVRWNLNRDYYGAWLLDWHTIIRSWKLEDFDHVLSDNLVEPLLYSNRVTLCGSFLWHDVLFEAFPENKFIEHYSNWCKDLLASERPRMIANRYFVTSAVVEQTSVHQVGLVPFCQVRPAQRANSLPRRVLIALGRAQSANGVTDLLARAASRMMAGGVEVFAAEAIFQTLQTKCPGIQFRSFGDDSLETIDLAVIRGGLGTISDCVASKVPMLYVDDPSPEIRYNQIRLKEMGIASPFEGFLNGDAEILTNPFVYRRAISRMYGFDLTGHEEASDFLTELYGVRRPAERDAVL